MGRFYGSRIPKCLAFEKRPFRVVDNYLWGFDFWRGELMYGSCSRTLGAPLSQRTIVCLFSDIVVHGFRVCRKKEIPHSRCGWIPHSILERGLKAIFSSRGLSLPVQIRFRRSIHIRSGKKIHCYLYAYLFTSCLLVIFLNQGGQLPPSIHSEEHCHI